MHAEAEQYFDRAAVLPLLFDGWKIELHSEETKVLMDYTNTWGYNNNAAFCFLRVSLK